MARKKKTTTAPATPEPFSDDAAVRELEQLSPEEAAQLDAEIDAAIIGAPGPSVDFDFGDVAEEPDRASASRARRLARVGCPLLTCGVLGSDLDVGPRSMKRARPARRVGDEWVSVAGATVLDLGLTPDELEHAAEWLRERDGTS